MNSCAETLLNLEGIGTHQHRNVFVAMESVTDEKRDLNDMARPCELIAVPNPRRLFHEHPMNVVKPTGSPKTSHLILNGSTRIL